MVHRYYLLSQRLLLQPKRYGLVGFDLRVKTPAAKAAKRTAEVDGRQIGGVCRLPGQLRLRLGVEAFRASGRRRPKAADCDTGSSG